MEISLGDSLLLTSDAADRVADELALRKNPIPRVEQMSVDVLACTAAQQAFVLERELSDRITLAIIPPGLYVRNRRGISSWKASAMRCRSPETARHGGNATA
jgi:hypothetical protein